MVLKSPQFRWELLCTKLSLTLFVSNEVHSEALVCRISAGDLAYILEIVCFTIENFDIKSLESIDSESDITAEKILKQTRKKLDGRYETDLLRKKDNFTQLRNTQRRCAKMLVKNRKKNSKSLDGYLIKVIIFRSPSCPAQCIKIGACLYFDQRHLLVKMIK